MKWAKSWAWQFLSELNMSRKGLCHRACLDFAGGSCCEKRSSWKCVLCRSVPAIITPWNLFRWKSSKSLKPTNFQQFQQSIKTENECWHVAQVMQRASRRNLIIVRAAIDFPSNGSDLCMANRSIGLCRRESIDGRVGETWRPLQCRIWMWNMFRKMLQQAGGQKEADKAERGEALWAAVSSRPFLSLAATWVATHPSIRNSSYLHPPSLQSVHQLLPTESLRRRRRELDPSEDLRGSEALNTRPTTLENHFLDPLATGAFLESTAGSTDDDDCLLNGFLSTVCALTNLCSIATGQHSLRWQSVGCD